ncbi:hypothetical protein D9758_012413 [Tetrapyrgos nigripes]|uniref:IRG-type G domain-containing protein n=1 Tax=Tetrapyrgos nigripes TaxID=182062 RepID=A0A8H5FZG1_9AGAR|nr:hypothetical protein D9758_019127 [Tetrapyrgos nigripes]KAF5354462.1 hypothetical protein D9758_012413 [Tetrapyrgos nigripes]
MHEWQGRHWRKRIAREEAEEKLRKAEDAARDTIAEAERAKDMLKKGPGIQPVSWPTPEEYARTLKARQYQEGDFNFAVAGLSGSGKSFLVNPFRGILDRNTKAAATGITETTSVIGRYPDPNPDHPFIWYDIPGADTLKVSDWEYFNQQGLYVFDVILILFDNRFTATDITILRNCAHWNIPSFIVRSKSDQYIQNLEKGLKEAVEEEVIDTDERRVQLEGIPKAALEEYTTKTRRSVKENLLAADLQNQRVYLISSAAVRSLIRGVATGVLRYLDEEDLITDIVKAVKERRFPTGSQHSPPVA